jgi:hypothetical protein
MNGTTRMCFHLVEQWVEFSFLVYNLVGKFVVSSTAVLLGVLHVEVPWLSIFVPV